MTAVIIITTTDNRSAGRARSSVHGSSESVHTLQVAAGCGKGSKLAALLENGPLSQRSLPAHGREGLSVAGMLPGQGPCAASAPMLSAHAQLSPWSLATLCPQVCPPCSPGYVAGPGAASAWVSVASKAQGWKAILRTWLVDPDRRDDPIAPRPGLPSHQALFGKMRPSPEFRDNPKHVGSATLLRGTCQVAGKLPRRPTTGLEQGRCWPRGLCPLGLRAGAASPGFRQWNRPKIQPERQQQWAPTLCPATAP